MKTLIAGLLTFGICAGAYAQSIYKAEETKAVAGRLRQNNSAKPVQRASVITCYKDSTIRGTLSFHVAGDKRDVFAYNSSLLVNATTSSLWNTTANKWDVKSRIYTSYDGLNNIILELGQNYTPSNNS